MNAAKRQPARNFQDLLFWQKSHDFVLGIYRVTKTFPATEIYGLTSQLRRAAVSIPANIAEGFKKRSKLDKARFMNIAQGSIEECRYYLILAHDLKYYDTGDMRLQLDEVSRLLDAYVSSLLSSVS
jgi:four helix bundle protein